MKIKICGLTRPEDVALACELGADICGFILASSPRQVPWDQLGRLVGGLPTSVLSVAVMVDPEQTQVDRALSIVDRVQLHGAESPEFCARYGRRVWKALRIRQEADVDGLQAYAGRVGALLLDSYQEGVAGGTGRTFPWRYLQGRDFPAPVFLAGGLTSLNVADARQLPSLHGLDVASGVEAEPGRKDPDKLRQFFAAARPQSRSSTISSR